MEKEANSQKPKAKVFVSGCYDLLHSGHVEFFRQAAQYGDLYVGIGSDKTYLGYKHRKTIYSEQERLFMVKRGDGLCAHAGHRQARRVCGQ